MAERGRGEEAEEREREKGLTWVFVGVGQCQLLSKRSGTTVQVIE